MSDRASPEPEGVIELEVHAELDVPGETVRQWRVLLIWVICLAFAVVLAVVEKPSALAMTGEGTAHEEELRQWRSSRMRIALLFGLALPLALTWWTTHRRRRGGAHARGIVVDITAERELRIWGRGHGTRVFLPGAAIDERLVDVFTGRMGAWRQRRLRVRARRVTTGAGSAVLELATRALPDDEQLNLALEGGEGDCIELGRDEYLRVLDAVRNAAS